MFELNEEKKTFFFYLKYIVHLQLYLGNLTLQEENIKYQQRHLGAENDNSRSLALESQGPDIKKLFLALFLKKAIK